VLDFGIFVYRIETSSTVGIQTVGTITTEMGVCVCASIGVTGRCFSFHNKIVHMTRVSEFRPFPGPIIQLKIHKAAERNRATCTSTCIQISHHGKSR
jgi:hypothetical protein